MKILLTYFIAFFFIVQSGFAQFKSIDGPTGEPVDIKVKPKTILGDHNVRQLEAIHFDPAALSSEVLKNRATVINPIYFNDDNEPVFFKGIVTAKNDMSIRDQAVLYLDRLAEFYEISNVHHQVKLVDEKVDGLNMTHLHYVQHVNGIPVEGLEMKLHSKAGRIFRANGLLQNLPELNTNVVLSQVDAESMVRQNFVDQGIFQRIANHKIKDLNVEQFSTSLIIKRISDEYRVVYKIDAYANLMQRFTYYVDAISGTILESFKNYCSLHGEVDADHNHDHSNILPPPDGPATATANDLFNQSRFLHTYEKNSKFYMVDASRSMFNAGQSTMPDEPVGVIWTIDAFNTSPENNNFSYDHVTSNNNSWTNKTAVSAHYNGGVAYEYFRDTHGRNSINGEGGNIISLINISDSDGSGLDNAFWNGAAMFYGNGGTAFEPLAKALDVAGHEMSHGVVQATANLTYQGESGAMNESFADIFGAMMDREDWKIGEDVAKTSSFPTGTLRDMKDPHNGGNSLSDPGWQPAHMNEKYTGSQDNGGVHINSGIVNHAYYLFATAVGKDKAELVYYRALTQYLSKSSQFIDLRAAVEQASEDLYDATVKESASTAFQSVGIGGGGGNTDYEQDLPTNPGDEYIVFTDTDLSNLFLQATDFSSAETLLSEVDILSKPSITDDGSIILYVGTDKKIHQVSIDWDALQFTTDVFDDQPVWRNVAISKDAKRIALLTDQLTNVIIVYDFALQNQVNYELYNPTYSEGVNTGDVDFADAIEFDHSGQNVLYDARNTIQGTAGSIEYWDIGFLNVFNISSNSFSAGNVEKLFSLLPENTSVGNPTFSKNSPYIIAFDYLDQFDYKLMASNIEKNEVNELIINGSLAFPNFNQNDSKIVYDVGGFFGTDLGTIDLDATKIESVFNSETLIIGNSRLGGYLSNGDRPLVGNNELEVVNFEMSPNPATDFLTIKSEDIFTQADIYSMDGKLIQEFKTNQITVINLNDIPSGQYILKLTNKDSQAVKSFIKQ